MRRVGMTGRATAERLDGHGSSSAESGEVVIVERREHTNEERAPRLEVQLEVSIASESNFYAGFTENLSEGGVFVATHTPRPLGSVVDLVIDLPGQDPIRTRGVVRWLRAYSEASDTSPGMGIRFEGLSPEDTARIHMFAEGRQPMFFDDD
jgi:uncharacterized protein (TIGR02266 family)